MKNYILLLALFSFIRLEAQETFIPIGKAKSKTEFISLKIPEDLKSLNKLVNSKNSCIGINANLHEANTLEIKELMNFLKQLQDLNHLELHYQTDSLQIEDVCFLKNIQKLRLFGSSNQYPQIDKLSTLNELECLGLNNITLNTMPVQLFKQAQFNEIELLCDTMTYVMATERILHYKMDSLNKKRIYISSYCEDIDLTGDSMYSVLIKIIPGSVKYFRSKRLAYNGKENSTSNDELISTISSKIYPNFKPLFPNEKKKYELATIDPNTSNSIIFNDLSSFEIPPNAFVNLKGEIVKSDVKIVYQSIRTQADIIRTGVPMTFDSAGKTEYFKTNGMFEIRAFSGNEALSLRQGVNLRATFPAKNDGLNYNLYTMNDNLGAWQTANYRLILSSRKENSYYMTDKTSMEDRFYDLDYTYVLPKNINLGNVSWSYDRRKRHKSPFKVTLSSFKKKNQNKIRSDRNLVKFRNFQDISDKENPRLYFQFNLYNSRSESNQTLELFPELKPFSNYHFEVESYVKSSVFYKEFKKGKIYNDVRILYEPGDNYGIILLKSRSGIAEIRFKTSRKNKKGIEKINPYFIRAFRNYEKLLKQRTEAFDKLTNCEFQGRAPSLQIYTQVPVSDTNTNYKLNVPMLGFFNCDRLMLMENKVKLKNPNFTCNGNLIDGVRTVYVVDEEANGTFTFGSDNVMFSKKNTLGIIIVTLSGMIYTIKKEILEALNLKDKSNSEIPMELMSTDTDSDKTIKSLGGG